MMKIRFSFCIFLLFSVLLIWLCWPQSRTFTNQKLPKTHRLISQTTQQTHSLISEPVLDTTPPFGLAVKSDQHLQLNRALRDVFDYYLRGGVPGHRSENMAQLHRYLKSGLPTLAYIDAEKWSRLYETYLMAQDSMVKPVSVSSFDSKMVGPDVEKMAVWLFQLSRLRQQILGLEAARVWFEEEETASQRVLMALRNGTYGMVSTEDTTQKRVDEMRVLRQQDTGLSDQQARIAQQFGTASAARFLQFEQEELAWKERYLLYRQAATQIAQQRGVAEVDRHQQIDALRNRSFRNEAERIRVQALDREKS